MSRRGRRSPQASWPARAVHPRAIPLEVPLGSIGGPRLQSESEELALTRRVGQFETEVPETERRRDATARRPREEPLVDQERLDHVLERSLVLADRGRERLESHRTAAEPLHDRAHHEPVETIEAGAIDVEPLQRKARPIAAHRLARAALHL